MALNATQKSPNGRNNKRSKNVAGLKVQLDDVMCVYRKLCRVPPQIDVFLLDSGITEKKDKGGLFLTNGLEMARPP